MNISDVEFHEATIAEFYSENSSIRLSVEGAIFYGSEVNLNVVFVGVDRITIDGVHSDLIAVRSDEGELKSVDICGPNVTIIALWHTYRPHCSRMVSYKFTCHAVLCEVA